MGNKITEAQAVKAQELWNALKPGIRRRMNEHFEIQKRREAFKARYGAYPEAFEPTIIDKIRDAVVNLIWK